VLQIYPVQQFGLNASAVHMQPANIVSSITEQIHSTGWGKKLERLRGLSPDRLCPESSLMMYPPQVYLTRLWWY
jgi:hypothetical protein